MEIWVWMEADLPYGQRLEGGRGPSYGKLSPVFFFISLTSTGCGPSSWSMAKRILEKKRMRVYIEKLYIKQNTCSSKQIKYSDELTSSSVTWGDRPQSMMVLLFFSSPGSLL